MKKCCAITLALLLALFTAACGCQKSKDIGNNTTVMPTTTAKETETMPKITEPIIDPTILDPTFETNIPDSTVDENSTMGTYQTAP